MRVLSPLRRSAKNWWRGIKIKKKKHLSGLAAAHITQAKFDASLMHVMPEVAAQERMVDDGTGQVEVGVIIKATQIFPV